ncbi:hypothetical protein ACH42_09795 [Endozoicomonas sp. (ex Bugula neritina AB1)]|nr:hypothetical protein ACH42_09795 [Endozoicomonas sp. (ex Bugula neritina AB1)]
MSSKPFTARQVAELMAAHMVSRDIACIKPDQFKQQEVYENVDPRSQKLIKHFEAHRRHLLEAVAIEHPEVLDAI